MINRYTLGVIAALALAGCGGQVAPTGGTPQSLAPATHGKSWMLQGASSGGDLVYVLGYEVLYVISYPQGQLVGKLELPYATNPAVSICSDSKGDIFVPEPQVAKITEYAHGGTQPIAAACSVDSTTGNVAVVIYQSSSYDVAVFSSPSAPPITYSVTDGAQFCGYDNAGNLFVDSHNPNLVLSELQKGGSGFIPVSIHIIQKAPGQLQWDGKYLALEGIGITHGATLYRLEISGSSATVVHTTKFKGMTKSARQSWIEGKRILIPFGTRGNGEFITKIGIWKYPGVARPYKSLKTLPKD